MTTDAITLSDRHDLLSIIPVVLGYHPTHSVVVACLAGSRRRMGPVLRVDFPTGDHLTHTLTHLADLTDRHAHTALILLYHPTADTLYDEEIVPIFHVPSWTSSGSPTPPHPCTPAASPKPSSPDGTSCPPAPPSPKLSTSTPPARQPTSIPPWRRSPPPPTVTTTSPRTSTTLTPSPT